MQLSDLNYDKHGNSLLITKETREEYFLNKLKEIFNTKIIITDRLHGFIFSFVLNIPCIVLKTADHKLAECAKWFDESHNIYYVSDDYSLIGETVQAILEKELYLVKPKDFNNEHFIKLTHVIKEFIEK